MNPEQLVDNRNRTAPGSPNTTSGGAAEWLGSFEDLVAKQVQERTQYLLRSTAPSPAATGTPVVTTDYVNTIPVDQEPEFPGDEEIERKYRSLTPRSIVFPRPLAKGGDYTEANVVGAQETRDLLHAALVERRRVLLLAGELDAQDRGRCTSVLRKEPSGWLIQHEHCSKTKPQGMER